eukprot:TRINITY_DN725_c0_g1_i1.p1 TRINITY_DN725_c0_g1~~TRINITY_DN725_c0_g1_i1.p1  ORF type:complete len:572 (+),score=177.06 TRINITY_DN725_c0_g1_i1:372-2087(+)
MYNNSSRGLVTSRISDQLDNLKQEFETMAHEHNMYKVQRDDLERKVQNQVGELTTIQQTLYDLQQAHNKIKQQYESEIMNLRRQLEMSTGNVVPYPSINPPSIQMPGVSSLSGAPPPSTAPRSQGPPSLVPAGGKEMMSGNGSTGSIFYGMGGSAPGAPDAKRNFPPPPQGAPPALSSGLPLQPPKRGREEYSYPAQAERVVDDERDGKLNRRPQVSTGNSNSQPPDMEIKDENRKGGVNGANGAAGAEDADWIVGYNSGVQTNLNIDLSHNLDHSSVVCCVRFSNDGKHLATGCNKSAQIYDVTTGEKIHTFAEDPNKEGDLYIRSVCFSPDNKFLAVGAEDKTVKVWDVENKRMHHTFAGHGLDIYSLDFSRDGNLIVSGSGDQKARIWDLEKKECVHILGNDEVGPKDGVTSVAFSPDGKLVAAGSLDRIVRVWDATTGYFLERYEGHLDSVYSVAFSKDGKTLASGSLDKTLKLWDIVGSRSRSRCRSTFTGHKDYVLSVAFSPDGNWLISGSKDRSVQFWDPRSAITHMMLQGHKNSVISVAVSPTGRHFATGSGDCRARLWKFYH